MKSNIKLLFTFLFVTLAYISISGCGAAYFDDQYEFYKGQQNRVERDPMSYVSVCSDYFTKKEYIESMAAQYCSKTNTVAVFVAKRYYRNCSLLSPIDYVYNCQNIKTATSS
ncbi:hypothetical protein ACFX5K_01585 [Rickettsiales bacterium LUAb2]